MDRNIFLYLYIVIMKILDTSGARILHALRTTLFPSHEILTVCTINTTSIMNIMKQRVLFLVMKI
jgi:hypothetical protein